MCFNVWISNRYVKQKWQQHSLIVPSVLNRFPFYQSYFYRFVYDASRTHSQRMHATLLDARLALERNVNSPPFYAIYHLSAAHARQKAHVCLAVVYATQRLSLKSLLAMRPVRHCAHKWFDTAIVTFGTLAALAGSHPARIAGKRTRKVLWDCSTLSLIHIWSHFE